MKDKENIEVRIFLLADAVNCAIKGQKTPNGYYNIERSMELAIMHRAAVKICGSCAEARGPKDSQIIEGSELSTMAQLAEWPVSSDKDLVF